MADPEYAHEVWVEKRYPPGVQFDSFTAAITFFFDDAQLENREKSIGVTVVNDEEWRSIKALMDAMLIPFYDVGIHVPDEKYLGQKNLA